MLLEAGRSTLQLSTTLLHPPQATWPAMGAEPGRRHPHTLSYDAQNPIHRYTSTCAFRSALAAVLYSDDTSTQQAGLLCAIS